MSGKTGWCLKDEHGDVAEMLRRPKVDGHEGELALRVLVQFQQSGSAALRDDVGIHSKDGRERMSFVRSQEVGREAIRQGVLCRRPQECDVVAGRQSREAPGKLNRKVRGKPDVVLKHHRVPWRRSSHLPGAPVAVKYRTDHVRASGLRVA